MSFYSSSDLSRIGAPGKSCENDRPVGHIFGKRQGEQGHFEMRQLKAEEARLETPSMVGYRYGMSSSSVIGRRLGRLYDVPSEVKGEIDAVLRKLDRKLETAR